jgi:hypothetical protein
MKDAIAESLTSPKTQSASAIASQVDSFAKDHSAQLTEEARYNINLLDKAAVDPTKTIMPGYNRGPTSVRSGFFTPNDKTLILSQMHETSTTKVYMQVINGGLPLHPSIIHVVQASIPPPPPAIPAAPVAGHEQATIAGDPHVTEADGGHFDFQGVPGRTYNMINDSGFTANAKFQSYQGNQGLTTIGEIGIKVDGPYGSSYVRINPHQESPLSLNGLGIAPGQTHATADGGALSLSLDGKTINLVTREGYQNTITVQGSGAEAYLDYSVKSGAFGVAADGKMPGGVLGQTFDADPIQRNGRTGAGAQGEGAIAGRYTDYEVPGGVFGYPQPSVVNPGVLSYPTITDPLYQHYFGIAPGTSPALIPPDQIQQMWDTTNSSTSLMIQDQFLANSADAKKAKKQQLLLQLALSSGNMDMAMLLISSLETRQANQIAGGLAQQIQKLQDQRSQIAEQMGQLGNDKQSDLSKLNTQASGIGTEISMLQTFLQDVMSQKNEAQTMASNFLKSRHDTAMGILHNMGS